MEAAPARARHSPIQLEARQGAFPLGAVLLGLAAVGAVAVSLLGLDRLPVSFCYFKILSGFPCMSCGTTRALAGLARLDLDAALTMNPLAAAAGLALLPWGLADLALLTRSRALRVGVDRRWHAWLRFGLLALLAANWAYLIAVGR